MNTSSRLIALAAVAAALACGRADGANKYWTGTGIWNTTNAIWGTETGGPYTSTWSNSAPDAAIFEGTAGNGVLEMALIPNAIGNRIAFTAGTLGFGSATALGTGTVTFSGNATLRAAVSGTLANIMSTGASSAVTATIDTQANTVRLSGSIGGSGNLAKIGSATLTLTSANNAYTGATTISAGLHDRPGGF